MSLRVKRLSSFMMVALATITPPVGAQDTALVTLIGEVRDITNDQPVEAAAVKLLELDLMRTTDRNGFFSFVDIPPGRWTFEVSQLGYATSLEASEITANNVLLIRLETRPIEISGLYVSVVQRLARRRMAARSRVIAWEKAELAEAISADIGSFIRSRGVAQWVACGGEFTASDLPNCFLFRGAPTRVRLFVDDIEMLNAEGMGRLWAYDPRDLWAVEFMPGCHELRIYTRQFMELVQSGRVRLLHQLCVP